jgi:WD40 repeat protein
MMSHSRSPVFALIIGLLALVPVVFAVGPPARGPSSEEVQKLIDQLSADELKTRKTAMKKLESLGDDVVPALRAVVRRRDEDVEVRLRAAVVARAIHEKQWGLVRALGAGASLTVSPWGGGYWLNRVKFSRDGKYAVTAGGGLILYNLATGKEERRALEVGGARTGLAVSVDGKYALTAHTNSSAFHLVEVPSLKTVQTFPGTTHGIHAVALSPDGTMVASADTGNNLRLWSVETGKEMHRFTDFIGSPRSVAFSPDSKRLLAGLIAQSKDDLVRLYEIKSGKLLKTFRGHNGIVTGVAFRPNGKSAVTAASDGTIRLWNIDTGKEVRTMTHGGHVYDLAVSPDGKRALSAGFTDRRVKVWDLESGRLLESFEHVGAVLGVAFSADGRRALSSDSVCCVRLWKLGR